LKILFITDNFYPEVNAPASRTYEHALRWVKKGVSVTVITCAPNFPEGVVFTGYKNKLYQREKIKGINVVRVKTFITKNDGFILRILDYVSFMISAFIAGLFQRKIDIIVATSPQFFTACAGWALSLFHRKHFVFELRDMWPKSIVVVGAMKKSISIKILEKLEFFLYKKGSLIIAVTNSFKKELIDRGVDAGKVKVVTNGVDLDYYHPFLEKDRGLLNKYRLEDKFVVGYIGTHGVAHNLKIILKSANYLKKYSDIKFLMVGSGSEKEGLVCSAIKNKLNNIVFTGMKSKESISRYWSLCDICIISLKDKELFSSVLPSKLFESMGMGVPVVVAVPRGEATAIVKKYNCGIIIPPNNDRLLSKAVLMMKGDNEQLKEYRVSSLNASIHFSRDAKSIQMLNFLQDLMERK